MGVKRCVQPPILSFPHKGGREVSCAPPGNHQFRSWLTLRPLAGFWLRIPLSSNSEISRNAVARLMLAIETYFRVVSLPWKPPFPASKRRFTIFRWRSLISVCWANRALLIRGGKGSLFQLSLGQFPYGACFLNSPIRQFACNSLFLLP